MPEEEERKAEEHREPEGETGSEKASEGVAIKKEEEKLKPSMAGSRKSFYDTIKRSSKEIFSSAGKLLNISYKNFSLATFMLVISISLHIIDVLSGWGWGGYLSYRYVAYLLLMFLGILIFKGALMVLLIGTFAIFGPPLLLNAFVGTRIQYYANLIFMLFPVWPATLFFLKAPETQKEKITIFKFLRSIYLLLIFLALIYFLIIPVFKASGISETEAVKAITPSEQIKSGTQKVFNEVKQVPKAISGFWEKQIYIATGGDYYSGQVEQNKKEPVGVYIENIKQADPKLYDDQPVIIWATLKAKTIMDKEINIIAECKASEQPTNKLVQGKINGETREQFKVIGAEDIDLQCEFAKLSKGAHLINISAEFNFETFSYIKAHFMERQRIIDLKRQGIDPLTQYKITERNPIAVYTNGPVAIGMDLPEMPIGLTQDQNVVMPTLGITIENRWEGRIKKINRLLVYVPEGLALERCDHKLIPLQESQYLEGEKQTGYTAYLLDAEDPLTTEIANQPTGSFRTFKCRIKTINTPEQIIGTAPIITKNFKLTISYNYELIKNIQVYVEEGVGTRRPIQITQPAVTPQPSNIDSFILTIDTTKYNDLTYRQIIESSPGGVENHELIAAMIIVATGVNNIPKTTDNCAGITKMCGPLATKLRLCNDKDCSLYDYRLDVVKHINAVASYMDSLKKEFTIPTSYYDKEKFALASYAAGDTEIVKRAIVITAETLQKTLTELTWEEVSRNINSELLGQFDSYKGKSEEERNKIAEDIKSYVSTVTSYKNELKGKFR